MTLKECTAILAPLAIELRVDLDAPTFRAYHRSLQDVSAGLLDAAVDTVRRTPRGQYEPVFPDARRLREYADKARTAMLNSVPKPDCQVCGNTGWRSVADRTVEACDCKREYRERLSALGLGPALVQPQLEAGDFDARMAQVGSE